MSERPLRLADKVAVVTGTSSGLGRAIALAFAHNGIRLVVCADLRPEPHAPPHGDYGTLDVVTPTHELIRQKHGEGKAVFMQADVTSGEAVEGLVQKAVELGGRLDIMVNNAGTAGTERIGRIHEMEEKTFDFIMNVNIRSVFHGCRSACGQFLRQEPHASGHRGWIINTASIYGLVGHRDGGPAYSASKGAVVNLTRQVAVDYARDRIHCNALCPGYLRTPMTQIVADSAAGTKHYIETMTPWGDYGDPQDVAQCAVFLASDDAAYVTGLAMAVDGGYTAA